MIRRGMLLCLDPGFDGTGVAIFRPDSFDLAPMVGRGGRALERLELLKPAGKTIEEGVLAQANALGILLAEYAYWPPLRVVLEAPSYTGTYAAHQGRNNADGLAKLNRTIGGLAVAAQACGGELEVVAPDGLPKHLKRVFRDVKAYRRAAVLEELRLSGKTKENLPGWGRFEELQNQDKIDAIWLGLRWLGAPISLPTGAIGAAFA